MNIERKETRSEMIRFCIVGAIAVGIQYGVYRLFVGIVNESVANTIGYLVSFACNFILTTYFTFRVKPDKRKATGFAFSHLINWGLQTLFLNVFLWMGMSAKLAPLPMFAICVPINFVLVRHFVNGRR